MQKRTAIGIKIITQKKSEKQIENEILAYLNILPNCFAWKNNSVGVFDPIKKVYRKAKGKYNINGVSDIIAVINGLALFIEVKTPSTIKRVSEDQKWFIEQVREVGAHAFVACSVAEVAREINKIKGGTVLTADVLERK